MALINNDRIEEFMLIANDRMIALNRRWWYALGIALIVSIPLFFILKYSLSYVFISNYVPPVVNTERPVPAPLQVIDRMIFELAPNSYSAFVKIRNINLEQGVPELSYSAKFKTVGGTLVTEFSGRTFVLPASEKILSFARFNSEQKPELVEFTFSDPKYTYRPQLPNINLEVQRVQIERTGGEFYVEAGVRNLSAFTIKQIYLPVVLYDRNNKIVGVSSTLVNNVKSAEIRTFRFLWPRNIAEAVRAEIHPEVNVFEKGILLTDSGGVQSFEGSPSNETVAE